MEFEKTAYCRTGLGKDLPECHRCGDLCTKKRVITGGPDIAGELMKLQGQTKTGDQEPYLMIPDSITTKEALSKFIESQGHKRGSETYWQFYKMYSEKYNSEYQQLNKKL